MLTKHHFVVYSSWLNIAVWAGHLFELLHRWPCSSAWEWRRQEVPAHFPPLDWLTAWLWCLISGMDQYGTWQVLCPMQREWKDSTVWRVHWKYCLILLLVGQCQILWCHCWVGTKSTVTNYIPICRCILAFSQCDGLLYLMAWNCAGQVL